MPKISEFPEAEALTGDEAVPVARTVGGVAETVRVPLSLLLALLDGASFADLAGAPGDNAALAAALAAKAPLDSPALAGTPTAPTAAGGTSTAQLATCAFVMGAIAALVGAAPENLNSFQEFADALGEDPNFATTILDQLAGKADAAATTAALAQKSSLAGAETLENKEIAPRSSIAASQVSPWAWNSDGKDGLALTAQSADLTIGADSGAPTDFRKRIIRIKASAANRTITFVGGAPKAFLDASGGLLAVSGANWTFLVPAGKTAEFGLIYDALAQRWRIVGICVG